MLLKTLQTQDGAAPTQSDVNHEEDTDQEASEQD